MKKPLFNVPSLLGILALLGITVAADAAPTLKVSLGTRESGAAGNANGTIGANGGAAGGIEWVNKDGQTLTLDGTWQTFTWNMATDPLTPFAGATANGVLDGAYGTIEHLRLWNNTLYSPNITLWIDLVENTIDPSGPPPVTTTTIQDFEGFASNAEVMFQEPRFSGSTTADLDLTPNFGGVDNAVAFSGLGSDRFEFSYAPETDPSPADNWLRLTTFGPGTPQPSANPVIRYDQSSVVTVRIMGVPEPTMLALLGLPAMIAVCRRRRG